MSTEKKLSRGNRRGVDTVMRSHRFTRTLYDRIIEAAKDEEVSITEELETLVERGFGRLARRDHIVEECVAQLLELAASRELSRSERKAVVAAAEALRGDV